MTHATSGPTSPTPFAFYDRASSCLRTSQATFLSDSTSCSVTLPRSGSMRNGCLYARATLGPATSGRASSSSLPTPNASKAGNDTTLTCSGDGREKPNKLGWAVALLPTPAVNDMGEGKTIEAWTAWTASMRERHGNGNGHGKSLAIEALRMVPTPTARDHKGGDLASRTGGPSLPEAVKHLPTPTVDDASNVTRDSGEFQSLTRAVRMMPTPNASDFRGSTSPESAKDWEFRGVNLPERIQRLRGATTSPPSDDTPPPSDGQLRLL
jgi:hypothetical protein